MESRIPSRFFSLEGPVLSLDSPDWGRLHHAYGSAKDIPALLRQLADFPASEGYNEPWFSILSALAHQGDVYPASFAAVPHVVRILSADPELASYSFFGFPAWVEICRNRKGILVPDELSIAYFESLSRLPMLVALAAKREWDANFLSCALAAIAVSKGFPVVAEAATELQQDVAQEFLDWLGSR